MLLLMRIESNHRNDLPIFSSTDRATQQTDVYDAISIKVTHPLIWHVSRQWSVVRSSEVRAVLVSRHLPALAILILVDPARISTGRRCTTRLSHQGSCGQMADSLLCLHRREKFTRCEMAFQALDHSRVRLVHSCVNQEKQPVKAMLL